MYTHDEIEKWVLGIPFDDTKTSEITQTRPFTTLLGKTHFISEAKNYGGIIKKDREKQPGRISVM